MRIVIGILFLHFLIHQVENKDDGEMNVYVFKLESNMKVKQVDIQGVVDKEEEVKVSEAPGASNATSADVEATSTTSTPDSNTKITKRKQQLKSRRRIKRKKKTRNNFH